MTPSMIDDLKEGFGNRRLWMALAHENLRRLYRHTRLGFFWIAIGFLAFAGVKVAVFSGLSDRGTPYFATWLLGGFLVWGMISDFIGNGCGVFISSKNWIGGTSMPYSIYIFRSIWVSVVQTAIKFCVAIPLIVIFGQYVSYGFLIALIAFPMFMITAVPMYVVLGTICAYSRDTMQLIQTIMRIMFFATPIIWIPKPDTIRQTIADLNPFSYFLKLFREPVLEGTIPWDAILVWAITTVLFWIAAIYTYRRHRNHIVYWL